MNDSRYAVYILATLGPEIESNPGHAANAVLEGQTSGEFVALPSKSGAPPAVRPGIDTRRQARVERIKRHNAYNDEIGKQLRIAVSGAKFDPSYYKAELGQPRQAGSNAVTIAFRKAGGSVDGINLYLQRGSDTAPQRVGFFMRTPAIDTTPLLSSNKSEERSYTARAVIAGKEIGQSSDAVMVTLS
jgi:hypothetical protein